MAGIPGNPAEIREQARALQLASQRGRDAPLAMDDARSRVLTGWTGGQASTAFDRATSNTRGLVDALVDLGDAAVSPLIVYADALEAAQRAFAAAELAAAQAAQTGAAAAAGSPEQVAAGQAGLDAVAAQESATADALAANQRAAEAIEFLIDQAVSGYDVANQGRLLGAIALGLAQGARVEVTDLRSKAHGLTRVGRLWAGRSAWWKKAGNYLTIGSVATGQTLDDADNPNFSQAERAGRVVGQTLTVGLGTALGGKAGGKVGGALGGAGGIAGRVAGSAIGGVAGAVWLGGVADDYNDPVVDAFGEAADSALDWTRDHFDDVGDAVERIRPWR